MENGKVGIKKWVNGDSIPMAFNLDTGPYELINRKRMRTRVHTHTHIPKSGFTKQFARKIDFLASSALRQKQINKIEDLTQKKMYFSIRPKFQVRREAANRHWQKINFRAKDCLSLANCDVASTQWKKNISFNPWMNCSWLQTYYFCDLLNSIEKRMVF